MDEKNLIAIRRFLHQNAEVGFVLPKTTAFIAEQLKKMGYEPTPCGKAGLLATVGKKGGKRFLLRADIDGLPIAEQSGEPFACKSGGMHACGHDMHAAMLLGAASILKEREKELNGEVLLFFQAAEETLEGAKEAMKAGLLKKKVDGAMMLHVMTAIEMPVGSVVVASGVSAPAADFFTIKVQGKGCHGSAPWNGIDALSVGARIVLGLEELAAREIPASTPAVLTIGSMKTGGASNVISDSVELGGTLRSFDEGVRERVKKRMEEIAKGIGKAFRAKVTVQYGGGCPTLVNDEKLSAFATEEGKKLLGNGKVLSAAELAGSTKRDSGGSEDFAYISHELPSVMAAIAAGEKEKGYQYPLHHPKVRFDEKALEVGSCFYAQIAIRFLAK